VNEHQNLSELSQHDYDAAARVRALRAVLQAAVGHSTQGEATVASPQQEKEKQNMRKITLILATTLLCSVVNAAPAIYLPPGYEIDAMTAVKMSLKDPDSARGLRMAPVRPLIGTKGVIVLVIVNAKNGFGGYTGDTLFAVSFQGGHVTGVAEVR
jgi:hypothetical protein